MTRKLPGCPRTKRSHYQYCQSVTQKKINLRVREWIVYWNPSVPGGIQVADKGRLNYFIDCGLIITFLLAFITGVIKIPELTRYFGDVFLIVSASTLSKIHDISGMVMGLLVLAHIVLHGRWIIAMTKSTFGKKEP